MSWLFRVFMIPFRTAEGELKHKHKHIWNWSSEDHKKGKVNVPKSVHVVVQHNHTDAHGKTHVRTVVYSSDE